MPSIDYGSRSLRGLITQYCMDTSHLPTRFSTIRAMLNSVHGAHSLKFGSEQRHFITISADPIPQPAPSIFHS